MHAVMGAVATGASNWDMGGMLAGLGTSGRGAKVDQRFQKLLSNIDYKIQRQDLHRDDIRDLVDNTVSRMDMYNVVAALLLTFSLEWVCDNSVVSAEKESIFFPRWFSTVFIIHCFSSAGYLLFSLWFAMHCAIVSKAQGTKLLLHFARLSIPTKDEINRLRVRFFAMGADGGDRATEEATGEERPPYVSCSSLASEGPGALIMESAMPPSAALPGSLLPPDEGASGDIEDDHYLNDSDHDFQRHLRLWVKERGKWLSHDAYSRVCMVVGMNQLLQAMCYNLTASIFDISPVSALLCVLVAKVLSLHVYQIDVSVTAWRHIVAWFFCEFLPPILTMPLLFLMPPKHARGSEARRDFGIISLSALPLFALHGCWMISIADKLHESGVAEPTQAPSTVRTEGEDSEGSSDDSRAEEVPEGPACGRAAARSASTCPRSDGLDYLPKAFLGRHFEGRNARSLYQVFHLAQAWAPPPGEKWFDHTPAKVVRSFTLILSVWWFLAGLTHAGTILFEFYQLERAKTRKSLPGARLLAAPWPEPRRLFQVGALHCGPGPELLVAGRFASFRAPVLPNASLGRLARLERLGGAVATVLCGAGGCDALAPAGGAWGLLPLEELCARSAAVDAPTAPEPVPVPLPASWRLVAGAWEDGGTRRSGVLAGWDGAAVAVGSLRRAANGSWEVEPRFEVYPGIGRCEAGRRACGDWRPGRYDRVVALQLGSGGRSLAVLSGDGELDAWSLDRGTLAGRWRLGAGGYSAMCHNTSHLYLARPSEEGPILESAPLPAALGVEGGRGWLPEERAEGSTATLAPRLMV